MTTYSIKAPNGQTYQIEGPAGATADEVAQAVLAQKPEAGQPPAEALTYAQSAVAKPAPATLKEPIKIEDVLQALRNADAAGDTEAATRLAQLAVQLRPNLAPPSATPSDNPPRSGDSFTTQAGVPIQIDVKKAAGNAVLSVSVGILLCAAFFWFFLRRWWKKTKTTPHQTGLWWGSNLALLVMIKHVAQMVTPLFLAYEYTYTTQFIYQTLYIGIISAVGFFTLGYIAGWLFRRLKPLTTQLGNTSLHQDVAVSTPVSAQTPPSDALYAQAMSELEMQSRSMDRGLWARCYAESGGLESTAKAQYLRERAKQLADQSSSGVVR